MPRRLFLIVRAAVWTNFGINAAAVREEAVAARQLVRLALAMPEIHQAGLIELEHRYLQLTLNQEWPLLASGGSSPETEQAFFALHARVIELVESAKALAVIAVSVSTHEGTIAVPKTPLVAALQSALAGG